MALQNNRISSDNIVARTHPLKHGFLFALQKTGAGKNDVRQVPYHVLRASALVNDNANSKNAYYSVSTFGCVVDPQTGKSNPRRTQAACSYIPALWVDLDYVMRCKHHQIMSIPALDTAINVLRSGATGILEYEVTESIKEQIHRCLNGFPMPHEIVYTGNGWHLYWFTAASAKATPRWRVAMKLLTQRMRHLGADSAVIDTARVLRLPGSINTKAGNALCRTIWREVDSFGNGVIEDFDVLMDAILPFKRGEKPVWNRETLNMLGIDDHQSAEILKPSFVSRASVRKLTGQEAFFEGLNWRRLQDIKTLAEIRGGIKSGHHDSFLWASAVCLANSGQIHASMLEKEVRALRDAYAPSWSLEDAQRVLRPTIRRAIEYVNTGEDDRYRLTTNYLIEALGITPAEQLSLDLIVEPRIKAERKRERDRRRDEARRRSLGALTRTQYCESAANKAELAIALHMQGKTQKEIAATLGVRQQTVSRYISSL